MKTLFLKFLALMCITACSLSAAQFSAGDKIKKGGWDLETPVGPANVRLEEQHFVIYFLDQQRKVIAPPQGEIELNCSVDDKPFTSAVERTNSYLRSVKKIDKGRDYFIRLSVRQSGQDADKSKEDKGFRKGKNKNEKRFY